MSAPHVDISVLELALSIRSKEVRAVVMRRVATTVGRPAFMAMCNEAQREVKRLVAIAATLPDDDARAAYDSVDASIVGHSSAMKILIIDCYEDYCERIERIARVQEREEAERDARRN